MKQTYTFKIVYAKHSITGESTIKEKVVEEIFDNVTEYGWGLDQFFWMRQRGILEEYKGNKDMVGKYTTKMIWIPLRDVHSMIAVDDKTFLKRAEIFDFKQSDSFK